ncbi:MAG: hypothetical protein JWQ10_2766 [Herbaspirillum sp.]|jgi:hypothetical protein|nr:hypothetical protein [Herbaspirillum sp.]
MKFLILRKADSKTEAGLLPGEQLLSAMGKYHEELAAAGILRGAEGLQPSAKGVRLSVSDGKVSVIDGPFAETKELIAGFSMIDVPSKQDAIDWVKRWPPLDGDVVLEIREAASACPGTDAAVAAALAPKDPAPAGMRFMVMIKSNRNSEAGVMPDQKIMDAMQQFNQVSMRTGELLAGEGLGPSAKGTRVAFSGGKMSITDGPFTEIKELIAGFWLIRVKSKQDAIEWVKRCPCPFGANAELEIRQVYEMADFDQAFSPEMREAEERMRAGLLESGMQMSLAGAAGQA